MPKINNWAVITPEDTPYIAPELRTYKLVGRVTGHPKFAPNKDIQTSSIIGKRNGKIVTRSGTVYELGKVNPAYEEVYPEARKRLLNALQEIV